MATPEGGSVTKHTFFNTLLSLRADLTDPQALTYKIREKEQRRLSLINQPGTSDEEWRFTNLKPLYRTEFGDTTALNVHELLESAEVPESVGSKVVFVNGHIDNSLTDLSMVTKVARVVPFSSANPEDATQILEHLNSHMSLDQDAFLALNGSILSDGLWIDLPKNVVVDAPIHILFLNSSDNPTANAPRVLVTAGMHARATVIEESVGIEGSVYLNVPVLEFDLQRGAHVTHIKVQRDSKQAFHIGRVGATIARDGHYESYSIQLGSKISRNDVVATQTEEQMFATLDGLVLIGGDQISDTHTLMDHAKPHGESHQLHKVLVDGNATSVFNGKIFVRKDAQKVNSFQENRNLLLSVDGTVHTKPQLEIFADDVKCSHGATIGQLVPEELFYLKSRGLDDRASRELLTQAFALEVIENIPVASLRERLGKTVSDFAHHSVMEALTV
jgi:Fe-S cluster assembly protein SufD